MSEMTPGGASPQDVLPPDHPPPVRTFWAPPAEPPPPPSGTAYAGVGLRFAAWLLDAIPLLLLVGVLMIPIMADMIGSMARVLPTRPAPGQVGAVQTQAAVAQMMAEVMTRAIPGFVRAGTVTALLGLVYLAGSWVAFSRTPAMAVLGIRIVREEDGGRLNVGRATVRYAGYLLGAVPLFIGFAWAAADPRQQAWHDKLAGTLVVREVAGSPLQSGPPSQGPGRPSIGALADRAWAVFWHAPGDLLAALAVALAPGILLLMPLFAVYLLVQQDQTILAFRTFADAFQTASNPAAFQQLNSRVIAQSAPAVLVSAATVTLQAVLGAILVGACAAALDDEGRIRNPTEVTRTLVDRLPAIVVLGIGAAALAGAGILLAGLPAIAAALSPSLGLGDLARLSALAAACWIVVVAIGLYFGAIWLLALVGVVDEGVGAAEAVRHAWALSRGRMRWLVGIVVVAGLVAATVFGPISALPIGLLAEGYVAGQRLPVLLSLATTGLIALVGSPVLAIAFVKAYRAARRERSAEIGAPGETRTHDL